MENTDSFASMLSRLQSDDAEAWAALLDRYTAKLVALANDRLGGQIQQKVSPEDIVQSVFRTLYRRTCRADAPIQIRSRLWNLLVTVTLRKCNRRIAEHTAQRRDVRKEVLANDGEVGPWCADLQREPTADDAAALIEVFEQFRSTLEPYELATFELHLAGHTVSEIAELTSRTTRTIRKRLELIENRLKQMLQQ